MAAINILITTLRRVRALIQLTASHSVKDLQALGQRVRAKAAKAGAALPEGMLGPFAGDDLGRIAAALITATAPGYTSRPRTVFAAEQP